MEELFDLMPIHCKISQQLALPVPQLGIDHRIVDAFEIKQAAVSPHLRVKRRLPIDEDDLEAEACVKKSHEALMLETSSCAAVLLMTALGRGSFASSDIYQILLSASFDFSEADRKAIWL